MNVRAFPIYYVRIDNIVECYRRIDCLEFMLGLEKIGEHNTYIDVSKRQVNVNNCVHNN